MFTPSQNLIEAGTSNVAGVSGARPAPSALAGAAEPPPRRRADAARPLAAGGDGQVARAAPRYLRTAETRASHGRPGPEERLRRARS
mgnify:CR=1 FL=1